MSSISGNVKKSTGPKPSNTYAVSLTKCFCVYVKNDNLIYNNDYQCNKIC